MSFPSSLFGRFVDDNGNWHYTGAIGAFDSFPFSMNSNRNIWFNSTVLLPLVLRDYIIKFPFLHIISTEKKINFRRRHGITKLKMQELKICLLIAFIWKNSIYGMYVGFVKRERFFRMI